MVEISEIVDRKKLISWFEEQPHDTELRLLKKFSLARQIAYRAAMRSLPMAINFSYGPSSETSPIHILRGSLISGIAARTAKPSERIKISARLARDSVHKLAAHASIASVTFATDIVVAQEVTHLLQALDAAVDYASDAVDESCMKYITNLTDQSADAKFFNEIQIDCTGDKNQPLWSHGECPSELEWPKAKDWFDAQLGSNPGPLMGQDSAGVDYSFWVEWYEGVLNGKPLNWDVQGEIALIEDDVWNGDVVVLMDRINGIWRQYYPIHGANELLTTGFLQFALSDFSFDEIRQVMKMVAEPDEVAHLRKGSKLTAFLDDAEELVDGLKDFEKSVSATASKHQEVAPVGIYTTSLIDEFSRASDQEHLRVRRLIDLGDVMQDFSLDAGIRGCMSKPIAKQFDRLVDQLLDLTRSHFAPSLLKLRPLNDLDLILDETPRQVVKKLREGLARIENIENPELVGMAPEDVAVLAKAIEELEGYLYALEIHGDEDVEEVKTRFKSKSVQITAAFGKYGVRAREHKDKLGSGVDEWMKWVKRTKGIQEAFEFFKKLFEGGGPPVG